VFSVYILLCLNGDVVNERISTFPLLYKASVKRNPST
jgi:hypothetical protein